MNTFWQEQDANCESTPANYPDNISNSGLSIYDPITVGDPELWIPAPALENLLNSGMRGLNLSGLPLRTRSKVVKEQVCKILGYPIPASFKRQRPRFLGQLLDVYVQKSNNLQIWNEELEPTRRYAIMSVTSDDIINQVKVVTGADLALLDKTGTLTQKYQAHLIVGTSTTELVSQTDTAQLEPLVDVKAEQEISRARPIDYPSYGAILPIELVFEKLRVLVGMKFSYVGYDQERNRGAELHKLISKSLGYHNHADDGRFPDIRHQLIEVKLQTSPTIDLGLVCPNSTEPLDIPIISGHQIRHCDVRYALFYAEANESEVLLTHLYLITGQDFFSRFPQFQGKVLNKKLQIPLPREFFNV